MIRILIVDDQKSFRAYIEHILMAESNLEIVGVAQNGYEGTRLAKVLNPDLILMDLEMPRCNGLVATHLICQQNPDATIVILSGHNLDDSLAQIINAGATDYLLKSTAPKELVHKINFISENNKLVRQKPDKSSQIFSNNHNGHKQRTINATSIVDTDVISAGKLFATRINESKILPQSETNPLQSSFASLQRSNSEVSTLLSILKRRCLPALMGFSGVIAGAILYLIFAQRTYQVVASISIQERQGSISELGKNLSSISDGKEYSPLATQANLINSMPIINDAFENIAKKKEGELLKHISINKIQKNLEVKILPNTNILEVSYVDINPKSAVLILNEIINTVITKNTNTIRTEASSVRKFLEKKVAEQQTKVKQLETAENLYREQKGIVALESQTTNLVNSLNSFSNQEQNILANIKEQEAKVVNLQQIAKVNDAKSAYSQGKIGQDRQLENLRSQLTDVEAEIAVARSNFTENNPTVISLLEKKEKLLNLYQQQVGDTSKDGTTTSLSELKENGFSQEKGGLSQEVFSELITNQTQLEANKDKLKAIQAEKGKVKNQIASLPAKVQPLTDLVRQRKQANESLEFLQRKLEEARIAEAQLVSNIQIVELANTPSSPSFPKIPLVLAIASIIGIILATGIILFLEKIDNTLYDATEVESQLHIPFLTALPNLSLPNLKDPAINLSKIRSFLNKRDLYEPYRFLLKQLESRLENRLKVIVVTSAIAKEGKSVVVSRLGAVSAMLSKRTLIIDAHLYQPQQHCLFNVKLQPGLTEIVTDRLRLAEAVQPTEIKHLSVLASGTSDFNSCELLESPAIQTLLQEAATQYDLVIVDAPAVSDNCDAYTLSRYSNGLVMVTRPSYTTKNALGQAVMDLKSNKASIIGFVVNQANKPKPRSSSNNDNIQHTSSLLLSSSQTGNSQPDHEEVSQR